MRAFRPIRGFVNILLTAVFFGLGTSRSAEAQTIVLNPSVPYSERSFERSGRLNQLEARVSQLETEIEVLSQRRDYRSVPSVDAATAEMASNSALRAQARSDSSSNNLGLPLKVLFKPGFALTSNDDEYQFQVHNITQFDGRLFQQGGQDPVKDTFLIPRQWFIFNGRLTKNYEYLVSLAHGFGAVNLLDTYINIHFDDRLQIKAGRYFVPFTFEPYLLPIHALITPEFSLFFNNFEPNRDLGIMAWGQLAKKRVDYAAGVFNGTKNGYLDTNDAKDFIGFLNTKPFGEAGISALKNLNVGGSVEFGNESNAPNPQVLRTVVSAPGNATIGVPFLRFGDNIRESGRRELWSLHLAYYYGQLSLIGEWDGGFQDYSGGTASSRTRVPVQSFYVAAGYFLTGEMVASRGVVEPLRPFDLRQGKFGLGAWELAGRYNWLAVGGEVFTQGLADPNLWSNRAATIDVGVNWYLNPNVKVALFWEHSEFGRPVLYRPGALQLTSDLALFRVQFRF